MKSKQQFSKEFKEAIVKKLLSRGQQTLSEFCRQNNLAISTVSDWKKECASVPEMNSKKNKSKLYAENILKIISETYSLNEEDLGLYLRKHGLHSAQINEWRSSFLESVSNLSSKSDSRSVFLLVFISRYFF